MRFAISLLTVLAIASVIGTVIEQNLAANAYLNQFGQFWDPVFARMGLYTVYNTGWFVAILGFLVLSTTLCIIRQFSPMLREIRGYREHAREASLERLAHHASLSPTLPLEARRGAVSAYLAGARLRFRVDERAEGGVLFAAKQGSAGRIGYFLAHGAIVLICAGGLLDGNLPLNLQMRLGGKVPTSGNQSVARFPDSARFGAENWSYRGSVYIPEGGNADFAVLNVDDGVLLQSLPFKITLKRFHIDYYASGMPRRYASDLVISDPESGESFERTLEVNKPLEYRGVTLFQSGFDDGGSLLRLNVREFASASASKTRPPHALSAEVGARVLPAVLGHNYTLEITSFRPINVENTANDTQENSSPLANFLGSGAQAQDKNLHNLGPLFTFKLRDATGQAREFSNYMLPVEVSGHKYSISGVRDNPGEAFNYLRIPLDDGDSLDTWFAIQQIFADPARQPELVKRFVTHSLDEKEDSTLRERLQETAESTLALFAKGGFEALTTFIESQIPEAERERAGAAFIQILQGLTWDAWMMVLDAAGKPALEPDKAHAPFLRDTLMALADSTRYSAPFYLQLTEFEQRQATVLQASRSPGKPLVYFGSLLLVIGVFAMLYIRERRLFVLLKDDATLVAMSSNRKTIDVDEAFARHREGLAAVLGAAPQN
jgi:cytochrome c biogenesis protein